MVSGGRVPAGGDQGVAERDPEGQFALGSRSRRRQLLERVEGDVQVLHRLAVAAARQRLLRRRVQERHRPLRQVTAHEVGRKLTGDLGHPFAKGGLEPRPDLLVVARSPARWRLLVEDLLVDVVDERVAGGGGAVRPDRLAGGDDEAPLASQAGEPPLDLVVRAPGGRRDQRRRNLLAGRAVPPAAPGRPAPACPAAARSAGAGCRGGRRRDRRGWRPARRVRPRPRSSQPRPKSRRPARRTAGCRRFARAAAGRARPGRRSPETASRGTRRPCAGSAPQAPARSRARGAAASARPLQTGLPLALASSGR